MFKYDEQRVQVRKPWLLFRGRLWWRSRAIAIRGVCASPNDPWSARRPRSRRRSRSWSVIRYVIAIRMLWTTISGREQRGLCHIGDPRSAKRPRLRMWSRLGSTTRYATKIKPVWTSRHDMQAERRLRSEKYIRCVSHKYNVATFCRELHASCNTYDLRIWRVVYLY